MPRFKVKDLMINVLSSPQPQLGCEPCSWDTTGCPFTFCLGCTGNCTITFCGGPCSLNISGCLHPSQCHPAFSDLGNARFVPPDALGQLKIQLQQALARVEVQERVMNELLRPQNMEQIELLEQKLR